jgi:hypothetical protein
MFGHRHGDRHARGSMFGMGGGRFGGHRHGGGHRGRLGRFFDYGDLRYVLLGLLAEWPRHGYELIKAIEEKFGRGPLTADQVRTVTAVLDRAASEIEQG